MLKMQSVFIMCIVVLLLLLVGCEKRVSDNIADAKETAVNIENASSDKASSGDNTSGISEDLLKDSTVFYEEFPGEIDKTQWNLIYVDEKNSLPNEYLVNTKEIPIEYIINQNARLIDERIYEPLVDMLEAAKTEIGLRICITSAYRDVGYQTELFKAKVQENLDTGLIQEEAEKHAKEYIALPGTSEHNTGLAVDLVSIDWYNYNDELNETFEKTEEAKWLFENAHRFGFIVSFLKEKTHITGVSYEPWHYRYVGIDHATRIKEKGYSLKEYLYYF